MMPIEPFDVFLSYSEQDIAVVQALALRLGGDGQGGDGDYGGYG